MYGTVARIRVKPENREALNGVFAKQSSEGTPAGMVAGYTLYENEGDGGWLVAIFEDRASYDKNADDPKMNDKYVEYRAFMEADPEWHDGDIEGM